MDSRDGFEKCDVYGWLNYAIEKGEDVEWVKNRLKAIDSDNPNQWDAETRRCYGYEGHPDKEIPWEPEATDFEGRMDGAERA